MLPDFKLYDLKEASAIRSAESYIRNAVNEIEQGDVVQARHELKKALEALAIAAKIEPLPSLAIARSNKRWEQRQQEQRIELEGMDTDYARAKIAELHDQDLDHLIRAENYFYLAIKRNENRDAAIKGLALDFPQFGGE